MITLVAVSVLGILCLVLEILDLRKILIPIVILGLTALLGLNIGELILGQSILSLDSYGIIKENNYAKGFSALFILLAIFIIMMSPGFYADKIKKISDYISLKVFLLAGAVAMVSFSNFVLFFLGLEVLSIVAYVLASSNPTEIKSNEAGMKYFLMGAVASAFVLFGIALIYGATGSLDLFLIGDKILTNHIVTPIWLTMGLIMLSIGMLFKASVFPFHFWAPDVYQGSPTLTTALMSTLVKVAAIGSFFYIISGLSVALPDEYIYVIVILSILTMTVANITALRQTNIKRMMAYSGISHAGFMIMSIIAAPQGATTVLYYAAAYALAGIAVFGVILAVCSKSNDEDISNFNGLFTRKPLLAIVMSLALMSLGGIPILSGFFAKFFMFSEMLGIGQVILVIAGVINSIIAIYYYFGVINVMFTKERNVIGPVEAPLGYTIAAVTAIVLNLALGIFPFLIMELSLF